MQRQGTFKTFRKNSNQNKHDRIIEKKRNLFCAIKCLESLNCKRVEIIEEKCFIQINLETNILNPEKDKIILEKIQKGKKNLSCNYQV